MELYDLLRKQFKRKEEELIFINLKRLLIRFLREEDIRENSRIISILIRIMDLTSNIFKILLLIFLCYKFSFENRIYLISWVYLLVNQLSIDNNYLTSYVSSKEEKFYFLNSYHKKDFIKVFLINCYIAKVWNMVVKILIPSIILTIIFIIQRGKAVVLPLSLLDIVMLVVISNTIIFVKFNMTRKHDLHFNSIFRILLMMLISFVIIYENNLILNKRSWLLFIIILKIIIIYASIVECKYQIICFSLYRDISEKNLVYGHTRNIYRILFRNNLRLYRRNNLIVKTTILGFILIIASIIISTFSFKYNIINLFLLNSMNLVIFSLSQFMDRELIGNIKPHFFLFKTCKNSKFIVLAECLFNSLIYVPVAISYVILSKNNIIAALLSINYVIYVVYHSIQPRAQIINLTIEDLTSDKYLLEDKVFRNNFLNYILIILMNTLECLSFGLLDTTFSRYNDTIYWLSIVTNIFVMAVYCCYIIVFFKDIIFKRSKICA